MKVRDAMTSDVLIAQPDQTIREAAQMMAKNDLGILPVGENDRIVGMITDRDIAVRAVAEGLGPDSRIADCMTREVLYCFDDEEVDRIAANMGENRVRRLPVLNREKRLVGIITLGDLTQAAGDRTIGKAVGRISTPGGAHSQTMH